MLSSILSRLFWWAFILLCLTGLANIVGQIRQKPIKIVTGKNSHATFGQNGIRITASRTDYRELKAPDTLVEYSSPKSDTTITADQLNGQIHLKSGDFMDGRAELVKLIETEKTKGNTLILDTQINLIFAVEHEKYPDSKKGNSKAVFDYASSSSSFETLPDGRILYGKSWYDNEGKKNLASYTDTFVTMTAAKIFNITHSKKNSVIISQQGIVNETLKILPANTRQHILFVIFDLVYYTGYVLLMLLLSKLFRNFSRHDFFTQPNVTLLSNISWCMLLPQLMLTIFYWGFLWKIHPAKILIKGNGLVDSITQYDIYSGLNWTIIFLGLAILTLSIIFKDGIKLKEEQVLTI